MKFRFIILIVIYVLTQSCQSKHSELDDKQFVLTEEQLAELNDTSSWTKIENDTLQFEIMFPKVTGSSIIESETVFEDTDFGVTRQYKWEMDCQKLDHVNLGYVISILKMNPKEIDKYFSNYEKGYYNYVEKEVEELSNSELIMKKTIKINGYPAREMWFKNDRYNVRIKMHTVLIGHTEYRYLVTMRNEEYLNLYTGMFIKSFKTNQ